MQRVVRFMKPYVGWKTWQPIRAEKKSRLDELLIATQGAGRALDVREKESDSAAR
jgi:hypothetical protein